MMNFATNTIMPLFARLVLASALLTSGWANSFSQIPIRAEIADALVKMGVEVQHPVEQFDADVSDESSSEFVKHYSTTRGVHRIVWLLDSKWPFLGGWASFIAWGAVVFELATGLLLLIGLFTRLSAFFACVVFGSALYIVSFNMHGMFSINPFEWPKDSHQFLELFAGLGLLTLSFWLMFGGAGGISVDTMHGSSAVKIKDKPRKKSAE